MVWASLVFLKPCASVLVSFVLAITFLNSPCDATFGLIEGVQSLRCSGPLPDGLYGAHSAGPRFASLAGTNFRSLEHLCKYKFDGFSISDIGFYCIKSGKTLSVIFDPTRGAYFKDHVKQHCFDHCRCIQRTRRKLLEEPNVHPSRNEEALALESGPLRQQRLPLPTPSRTLYTRSGGL